MACLFVRGSWFNIGSAAPIPRARLLSGYSALVAVDVAHEPTLDLYPLPEPGPMQSTTESNSNHSNPSVCHTG